ncbi:MAG: ChaN family lipoprotein, partial [Planctomycetes bacterium]|nr:ChaN family lipoprotein [Planctomycetota bacterium]
MWSNVSAITADLPLNSYIAIFGSTLLCLAAAAANASDAVMLPGSDEIIDTDTAVIDVAAVADIETLLQRLADKRVVFIGESHDRYEDHLNQLAIIAGLQAQGKDLAIGMEFFQQP